MQLDLFWECEKCKQITYIYYNDNLKLCKEHQGKYNLQQLKNNNPNEYMNIQKSKKNKRAAKYRKQNPILRIKSNLRKKIRHILKSSSSEHYSLYTGCSGLELRKHIESQFKEGMSWDNYGQWHIDHIKPVSKFNLNNLEERIKVNHFKNLQPLWAKDNIQKSNKYNE